MKFTKDMGNDFEITSRKFQNYAQFNKWLLLTIVISILLVVAVNLVVDPYGIYKTPNFLGINHAKIQKNSNDRLYKAIDIIRIKPVTIFLGTSRTKQGLDPNHPGLSNSQPTYNLALDSANSYEVMRYLQHTLKNQPHLKKVIFGVDYFMFNKILNNRPGFNEKRLEKKYIIATDILNSLFSIDSFDVSQKTVFASLKETDNRNYHFTGNGFAPYLDDTKGKHKDYFKYSLSFYLDVYHKYIFNDQYFDNFQKIVDICRNNNIELIIFISPTHATQWETLKIAGKWEYFEKWKQKLITVTPVWDFSGYNSINTEIIGDIMKNYVDNAHYTKPVGDLVLNRILGYQADQVPADFGVLLTPENIESHLAKIRAGREKWVKNNQDELELVQRLEQEFVEKINKSKD
ncbi:MAG: hypothetical protein F6K62_15800 [Sphaerospermopsis sp. SIO1G2]|nr:hypothetical protein [Sphaerospermopsis sp. SIO1G2]